MKEFNLTFGSKFWDLKINDNQSVSEVAPNLQAKNSDIGAVVRHALSNPVEYPQLCRAVTPDDHIAIVVDDQICGFVEILKAVVEHLSGAGIALENITVICPTGTNPDSWINILPDELDEIKVEVHDGANKKKLCFVATTEEGLGIYLNRTLVEAEQVVVLGKRCYSPLFGIAGAESDLFPAFSNLETMATYNKDFNDELSDIPHPAMQQAIKVAWYLGAPYFIQIVEGTGENIEAVFAGSVQANRFAEEKLNEIWMNEVGSSSDVVLAIVGGKNEKIEFTHLCRAVACASRVVKKNGIIVLLADAEFNLANIRKQLETKAVGKNDSTLKLVPTHNLRQWVESASFARVFVSTFDGKDDIAKLLASPIHSEQELRELVATAKNITIIHDAHKAFVKTKKR